ncbi:MAG: DNA repair protein RadA [Pseudomonadota bacterium]
MAKARALFVCGNCGAQYSQWSGKCDACGEWNTISQETAGAGVGGGPGKGVRKGRAIELSRLDTVVEDAPRIVSRVAELDRVTGGGFVRGSAVLLGGEPGIGKSTLLMQAAAALSRGGQSVIYVSGEEAVAQVQLRAQRLNAHETDVQLAAETNVEDILATLKELPRRPDFLVLDSIQTLWTEAADSAPGTVTQVRSAAQAMIRYAKTSGTTVVFVGHVTKEGTIAGPRVLEHMVDAVMQFEGDGAHQHRILRTTKNRFGPTDEIGVFEMTAAGLKQVQNPSELFLSERTEHAPGASVFAAMEGTRPVLVEVQALVAASPLGTPRRAVVGWDSSRLAMVLAVLETHCGVRFSQHDVYLNIAGGYRITEPAGDLAVAAALVSSLTGIALPVDWVYFGEISLSGAVRQVAHGEQRMKEAVKLGFSSAARPAKGKLDARNDDGGIQVDNLIDLVTRIAGGKDIQSTPEQRQTA